MANLNDLKDTIVKNNTIPLEKYEEFEVKRGLRNRDGSGVLAGLSRISSVIGARTVDFKRESVDGELNYRGHNITELAELFKPEDRYVFERAAYLLLVGEIPNAEQLAAFNDEIAKQRQLPDYILEHVIKGVPSKNVMNKLQTATSALYANDEDPDTIDPFENFKKSISLLAKMPIIIAYSYLAAYKKDPKFVTAPASMSLAEAFMYVLNEGKEATPFETQILDLCMAIHAEHGGGNNSTFTTYVITSSYSDIYCTMAGAVASLKGPLHGSANNKVMDMMEAVKANVKDWNNKAEIKAYLKQIMEKKAHDKSGKIYGLGHAVYTKSDPRAVVLKEYAKKLANLKKRGDEMQLYFNIEELGPELFSEEKGDKKVISPNVDFFSGFVYDCLNLPNELYTPIFAMSRTAGWCAHRIEEILSGKRIIRPGYKYVS